MPGAMDPVEGVKQRESASYSNEDASFLVTQHKYRNQQFASLYFARLALLRPVVQSVAVAKWPDLPICGILDLEKGKECIVVGTLYKHMKLKPSVLQEYSKERSHTPLVQPDNFTSEDDSLVVEDERGRVLIHGPPVHPADLVTGVVVALRGCEDSHGHLSVSDMWLPGVPPQPHLPARHLQPNRSPRFIAFLSGLSFSGGSTAPPSSEPVTATATAGTGGLAHYQSEPTSGSLGSVYEHMLLDLLTGHVGSQQEQSLSAGVVRVVIAGDSCSSPSATPALSDALSAASLSSKDAKSLVAPVKEFDIFLAQLAAAVPVDVMPGPSDPANFSMPQQPLHPCLLPASSRFSTLVRASNPHRFSVDGVWFLGSSGQPIHDMARFSLPSSRPVSPSSSSSTTAGDSAHTSREATTGAGTPVTPVAAGNDTPMRDAASDAEKEDLPPPSTTATAAAAAPAASLSPALVHMQRSLQWRHLAPTAPDTLTCYPFTMDDPFVLTSCPHVFFAGNQAAFSTAMVQGEAGQRIRLIAIPRFSETSQIVLMDLDTLDCHLVTLASAPLIS